MKKQVAVRMGYDKWFDTYKPTLVHKDPKGGIAPENLAPHSGCMFETYGEELEQVLQAARANPLNVWTLYDDGMVGSGLHIVNRLGYFICTVPFKANEDISVRAY
jgi:hypothetical protein